MTMTLFCNDKIPFLGIEFNVFSYSKPGIFLIILELLGIYLGMFAKEGFIKDVQTLQSLLSFAIEISNNYFDNPYHSFFHAIDVSYMAYYILTEMGVAEQAHILQVEFASLLIAALCHDVLHKGFNNLFEVVTCSS